MHVEGCPARTDVYAKCNCDNVILQQHTEALNNGNADVSSLREEVAALREEIAALRESLAALRQSREGT